MSDIAARLRSHVQRGGGAKIRHGAWDMMLEAADEIERLSAECLKQIHRAEDAENEANKYWQAAGCPLTDEASALPDDR